MKIIDSKGRLFGKVSLLDLGAGLVILLVFIGIFIIPGPTGSIAQVGGASTEKIRIDLIVRGLSIKNPQALLDEFNNKATTNIIIRNEPAGKLTIESAEKLERQQIIAPQPDGTVKAVDDPRTTDSFSLDMTMVMIGEGTMTKDGAVIANQKIKMGTVLELDGKNYNFRGSVINVEKAS